MIPNATMKVMGLPDAREATLAVRVNHDNFFFGISILPYG
jgi:hypothetical protein